MYDCADSLLKASYITKYIISFSSMSPLCAYKLKTTAVLRFVLRVSGKVHIMHIHLNHTHYVSVNY